MGDTNRRPDKFWQGAIPTKRLRTSPPRLNPLPGFRLPRNNSIARIKVKHFF